MSDRGCRCLDGAGDRETEIKGDVNLDGSVTMGDMVLLLRHLLGSETLTQAQAAQADLHPDGVVNGLDLCRMRQVLNG